jgi:Tfp pilus assembly protein PilX
MLIRLKSDERGIAMITALMVTFVVAALALMVVQLSMHNVDQSNYDRKRVQSVNASEAGVDYTWNTIEQTAPQSLSFNTTTHLGTYTGTLGTGPGTASFTSSVKYLDANGAQMTTAPSQTVYPTYALITSVGTTNGTVNRTVQSYVKLTPIRQAIQSAVLINGSGTTTFGNNFTINGDQGNDGDVHIEYGNLAISNQPNIYGNVYVSGKNCTTANATTCGTLSVSNNNVIHGNAWSWGTMNLVTNNQSTVLGTAQSSAAGIAGSGVVGGNATAGTTIAAGLHISGSRYPTSPTSQHPPAVSFPNVCWDTVGTSCTGVGTEYTNVDAKNNSTGAATPDGTPDWTIVNYSDCTTAQNALTSTHYTADTVVRINATCNISIGLNKTVTFDKNLVIFTNGGITMANQNNWNGQNNNSLAFIVGYQSGMTTSCSTGNYNIQTGQYSNFNNVYVSFYSPCTITLNNLNSFSGQILGGDVSLSGNFTMTYKPVLLPGLGKIVGFQQDVVYEREIAS